MKKEDFLEILRDYLKKGFSEDEVMDILRDYEEYFVDGIIEGKSEIEIIQSLGSPKEIANELLAESNIKSENKVKGKVENFFIEAKGKFKSGLNKFKVNLNDKEHVKSRKKKNFTSITYYNTITICICYSMFNYWSRNRSYRFVNCISYRDSFCN